METVHLIINYYFLYILNIAYIWDTLILFNYYLDWQLGNASTLKLSFSASVPCERTGIISEGKTVIC